MRDRTRNYFRPLNAQVQLAAFNAQRQTEFGRGPMQEDRLPLPFTMVGADIPEEGPEAPHYCEAEKPKTELAAFNESRRIQFGRAPMTDERLPIPFTMVGADLPDEPVK